MIACLDVNYRGNRAFAACVLIADWPDGSLSGSLISHCLTAAPYQAGRFYRRELSALTGVLEKVTAPLDAVVVDGYVWLDQEETPGLGAYLYRKLGETVPVIGVAKSRFRNEAFSCRVFRGRSLRPLYVTAAGMNQQEAADHILVMHGPHRIPTVIKKADRLCRNPIYS